MTCPSPEIRTQPYNRNVVHCPCNFRSIYDGAYGTTTYDQKGASLSELAKSATTEVNRVRTAVILLGSAARLADNVKAINHILYMHLVQVYL
jgi:hypothetical protein